MNTIKITASELDVVLAQADKVTQDLGTLSYNAKLLQELTNIISGGEGYKTLTESERLTRMEYASGIKSLADEYSILVDEVSLVQTSLDSIKAIVDKASE